MDPDQSPYRTIVRRGSAVDDDPIASVIVLVTSEIAMLERCLRSLEAHGRSDRPYETIVLANGTPPEALLALTQREDIALIQSPVNHGFAGGCNLATRFARADRLVFINDDVAVSDGWLSGLHEALDADQSVAVAGSRVLLGDGRLQEAGSVLWRDGSTSGIGRGRNPQSPEFQRSMPVDYVSFCSAMVRWAAWEEAGGFDERYFPAYYEDLDLCLTVRQSGWAVVYAPSSIVEHAEGASAPRHYRDFLSHRNQRIFLSKWGSVLADYEPRPEREAERATAVERSLRRAALRPVGPGPRPHASPEPRPVVPLEGEEMLVLAVRHLAAAVAVGDEYITALHKEAAARTLLDVLKHRLHSSRPRPYLRWLHPRREARRP